ncbi:hypothetical protein KA001_03605, partial [Patescibacteria group bacterium]|nr:hypothetical protein [Patescibacteria group bacterium]
MFQKGGGEKFFLYLISIFPTASIYVPIVSKYYLEILKKREIKYSKSLSQLSKFPKIGYPLASILSLFYFEKLKLNNFDVVVSLSNRFAHCVITSSTAAHLAIVTTPFRALYS